MSVSSDRGRDYERKIRKITGRALKLDVQRDKQSGAGIHKQDVRDRYGELPIFIECKDHETTKLKEWWREADGKSSYGQAPIVVFPDREEDLCVMRYSDLLQIIRESMDWKESADLLRSPDTPVTTGSADLLQETVGSNDKLVSVRGKVATVVENRINRGVNTCRNGHISDQWGFCQQLTCKYSRGYRPPKVKKSK